MGSYVSYMPDLRVMNYLVLNEVSRPAATVCVV